MPRKTSRRGTGRPMAPPQRRRTGRSASAKRGSEGHLRTETYNGMRGRSWNKGWRFRLGDAADAQAPECDDSEWRRLELPHDWSIAFPFREDSPAGAGGGYLDGGVGWYRKTFTLPAAGNGKLVFVGFDGVYRNSRVWINGALLGERPSGYASFEYDLTPHLHPGARNALAVRVDNDQPNSRWYSGSGIYRNVWLTLLDPVHVERCGVFVSTPHAERDGATVRIRIRVHNRSAAARAISVRISLSAADGRPFAERRTELQEAAAGEVREFEEEIPVRRPRLWSVDDPNLYRLSAEAICGGRATDVYRTTFGIRTVRMDADEGFFLNGQWLKLNGVCLHHDLGALGAAVEVRAIERQLEILKAMGCNAVRTSHNPPEPALLDLCDRMGFLVIDEAFDAWEEPKVANDYHRCFGEWAQTDLQEMIRRDRNHPCVVMYSIGNEIQDVKTARGAEWTGRLYDWARAADATRPVTHGSNVNESAVAAGALLDAVGYNYTVHLYDRHHAQFPRRRMYASETSSAVRSRGVYKFPTGENLLSGPDIQCSCYDNSVVEWGLRAEESWDRVNSRKFIAGEFIWSGFDYLGEPTPYGWPAKSSYFGILDTCGFAKDIYYFYQSKWTARPMVHLLPHWNWTEGRILPVWAYTNCEEVELFQDGVSLGARRFAAGGPHHLEWLVPFRAGVLRAAGRRGGKVVARAEVRTAGKPAAVRLTADRNRLTAGGPDLAFVVAEIVDAKGTVVPDAGNLVRFAVSGPGTIAGVDNGDPICHEPYQGDQRSAFHGKCLAILRSAGGSGTLRAVAESDGLAGGKISIPIR